jgi:hypothetical protein
MGAPLAGRFALTLAWTAFIGGAALVAGQAADIGAAQAAFGQSLTLRADRVIVDSRAGKRPVPTPCRFRTSYQVDPAH